MLAFIKYILSFIKSEWGFYDYPIHIKKQDSKDAELENFKLVKWIATISNWHQLFGGGETKEEAINMLRERFAEYKQNNKILPRPGVRVPIVFASTSAINRHKLIARHFFTKILNRDFDQCFISDKSSVWDFPEADDQIYNRIQQAYGIDVSDIKSGNFVELFERLSSAQQN